MQTITPYLLYEDVDGALDFLARAFGFEEVLRYTGAEGYVSHAEMRLGDALVYLGDPGEDYRNPRRLGGSTVGIYVRVDDVDAHHRHALERGAEVVYPPVDQPYGYREYSARDSEGHLWSFMKPLPPAGPPA